MNDTQKCLHWQRFSDGILWSGLCAHSEEVFMTPRQMQATQQNPTLGKKLHLRKETVKDLKLGKQAGVWPCGITCGDTCHVTDEDEFDDGPMTA
jgi:hypothetical protein